VLRCEKVSVAERKIEISWVGNGDVGVGVVVEEYFRFWDMEFTPEVEEGMALAS